MQERTRTSRIVRPIAVGLLTAATLSMATVSQVGAQTTTTKPGPTPVATKPAATVPPVQKVTMVASSKSGKKGATVTIYKAPDGKAILTKVKNPLSSRAVFSVISEQGDYYFVNLPVRPNGSKGYVKKSDVNITQTKFRIVISLKEKRLAVYENELLIIAANVAIGKPETPTPTGEFYVYWVRRTTEKQKPGWGDFVLGLSGFGNNKNYGEGRIGIHGTANSDSIGKPASSGCVRVSNEVVTQLKNTIYLGTPVSITE